MRRMLLALVVILFAARPGHAAPSHFIYISVESDATGFVALSAEVSTNVAPPRFDVSQRLSVVSYDSDLRVLASYVRGDPRLSQIEGGAPVLRPPGARRLFSAEIVPGLRRVRVFTKSGDRLLDFDAGSALVDACQAGRLPGELCASFDSDGDGCGDANDSEPLVPETEPPRLSGSVTPSVLWPPNHSLRQVVARVSASDNCTAEPEVTLTEVRSSEPATGVTPGDPGPDIDGADLGTLDLTFLLRAERWPMLSPRGRTYTIVYTARDRAGNTAELRLFVTVPHSQGRAP